MAQPIMIMGQRDLFAFFKCTEYANLVLATGKLGEARQKMAPFKEDKIDQYQGDYATDLSCPKGVINGRCRCEFHTPD